MNEFDIFLALKVLVCGLALVGCGYVLGRDKGVKIGGDKTVDILCELGYLKHIKKPDGNTELIKLNGEIE